MSVYIFNCRRNGGRIHCFRRQHGIRRERPRQSPRTIIDRCTPCNRRRERKCRTGGRCVDNRIEANCDVWIYRRYGGIVINRVRIGHAKIRLRSKRKSQRLPQVVSVNIVHERVNGYRIRLRYLVVRLIYWISHWKTGIDNWIREIDQPYRRGSQGKGKRCPFHRCGLICVDEYSLACR